MKKVIVAFEGTTFSEGAIEFARKLNEINPILLTGLFLPQSYLASLWSYASSDDTSDTPLIEEESSTMITNNIRQFEKMCQTNKINYKIHKDFYDLALPELKTESMFADLLILSSEKFYEAAGSDQDEYLETALTSIKCPVVVVPEHFTFPDSNLLTYDGKDDSIFAIKQFAYILPELSGNRSLVVFASTEKNIPEIKALEELTQSHFKNVSFEILDFDPKKFLSTWLSEQRSSIVVCGSYGRSGLSQFFKKSIMKQVIYEHKLPVFIAHR